MLNLNLLLLFQGDEEAGGEINEIDDEDEEDFLSNNQITLKSKINLH